MTQDETYDPSLRETLDAVTVHLEALLAEHVRPGRTMVLAVIVSEDGMSGAQQIASGDNVLEGANGLEFLAAQLRAEG